MKILVGVLTMAVLVHCGGHRSSRDPCVQRCLDDPAFCQDVLEWVGVVNPGARCPDLCFDLASLRGIGFLTDAGECYPYLVFRDLFLDPLRLVSTVPAAEVKPGQFEPVCMGEKEATGLILSMAILASPSPVETADQDLSLRPGDIVKTHLGKDMVVVAEGESIGPENIQVNIECLERYPDPDIKGGRQCQGLSNPGNGGTPPASFRYVSPLPPDEDGYYTFTRDLSVGRVGVAILIDQSGSMKGFVDPQTYEEVNERLPHLQGSDGFASDLTGQRIVAVQNFLSKLNPLDKAIVFQYGETVGTKAKVVCFDVVGNSPEEALRERCYSEDKGLVLDEYVVRNKRFPPALAQLVKFPDRPGRSPLWAAVYDVYEFMKSRKGDEVRHIIVIADGPDTCHPSSPDYRPCVGTRKQEPCSTVGYDDFRSRLLEDLKDLSAPRVHIHFVQFQAHGYLEHDPLQQEVSCLTGGHYQFVNSIEPAKLVVGNDWTALQEALLDSVYRLRQSLIGVWQMAVDLSGVLGRLQRGAQYALEGTITLTGAMGSLTVRDLPHFLRVGAEHWHPLLQTLDRRAVFRLPCGGPGDCHWFQGDAPVCRKVACRHVGALCGLQAVADGETCLDGGTCCKGFCCTGPCL